MMISDIGVHLLVRAVSQEGKAPGGGDGDAGARFSTQS